VRGSRAENSGTLSKTPALRLDSANDSGPLCTLHSNQLRGVDGESLIEQCPLYGSRLARFRLSVEQGRGGEGQVVQDERPSGFLSLIRALL